MSIWLAAVPLSGVFFCGSLIAMLLLWCSPAYLCSMAVLGAALIWGLRRLLTARLVFRRSQQQAQNSAVTLRQPFWIRPAMALWAVLSLLYLLELGFAAFVDTTDAFNATTVSARWFRRHVEPYRNSEGFRDRHAAFPRKPNDSVTRVFMIGDSFTIGQGINRMEDRFTERTEAAVNARAQPGDKPVTVYNLGEFGWEVSMIDGMVRAALQEGYQTDMIVYVYMLNDIEGYDPRTEEVIRQIQSRQPAWFLWSKTYFFNWMNFLWRQHQASRTVDYFPHLADSYRETPWLGVQNSLQSMHQACQQHGVEFRMVLFPFLHNLGPDYSFKHAHQQLIDFCNRNEIRCLDLEPILSENRHKGLTVNRFDNHPNAHCHAIVAKAIADQLLNDLPMQN